MPAIRAVSLTRYPDNGQVVATVEWLNGDITNGNAVSAGRPCRCCGKPLDGQILVGKRRFFVGLHMQQLFARAEREGLTIRCNL